jgi:predicted Rossmann fold nucleotide-binding protein DprA/Smf involved in DNA uptake
LVTETAHILEDLPALVGWLREQLTLPIPEVTAERAVVPTVVPAPDSTSRQLLTLLGQECRHADWLIAMSGLAPATVLQVLFQLEMSGLVASVPGGYERLPAGAAVA